jgi:monoterpene epsilon-lactone hydrolase
MSTQQQDLVHHLLRESPFDLGGDVATHRPLLEQMLTAHALPDDVQVTAAELGGVPVLFVTIDGVGSSGTLLHLHGGGFAMGSARGSLGLASELARRTGMEVVSVEYRLAPEHPYPAALQDVSAAYAALVGQRGGAQQLVVTGESAGGNLAMELLIGARQDGIPMPAAVVLFSPMTDLTTGGESYSAKLDVDPNITGDAIRTRVRDYIGDADPADPRFSPAFADLSGLPPLLIQAGSHEVLLDDATALAARAAADDVAVILEPR